MNSITPNGYNISTGGDGGDTFTFNPNRDKIQEKRKGVHNSPETEFKKGEHFSIETEFKKGHKTHNKGKKGIHYSPKSEWKKGNIPWNKGLKWSDEKRKYISDRTKEAMKRIREEKVKSEIEDLH
jgi:hypothetical protein